MDLTIREAATLLERSERTIRAQLQRGELRGRKSGRQWLLATDDLPLTAARRTELLRRVEVAHDAVEATLPRRAREARPERALAAQPLFATALGLLRELQGAAGLDPRATEALELGLLEFASAHAEFDPRLRMEALRTVRRLWARALGLVLLAHPGAPSERWVATLEHELLPRLGGLLRWTEKRLHGRGAER